MRKHVAIISILVLIFCVTVYAADDQASGQGFWKGLLKKVGQFIPKKKLSVTTSVAGVRAAGSDEGETLYWKDENKQVVVTDEELTLFKTAVNKAMEGDKATALKMFERFSNTYPDSPLSVDAIKAVENLTASSKQ